MQAPPLRRLTVRAHFTRHVRRCKGQSPTGREKPVGGPATALDPSRPRPAAERAARVAAPRVRNVGTAPAVEARLARPGRGGRP